MHASILPTARSVASKATPSNRRRGGDGRTSRRSRAIQSTKKEGDLTDLLAKAFARWPGFRDQEQDAFARWFLDELESDGAGPARSIPHRVKSPRWLARRSQKLWPIEPTPTSRDV